MRAGWLAITTLLASQLLGWTLARASPPKLSSPPTATRGPSTKAAIALGHRLFMDPRLSADGSIACASCHQPNHAFSDGRAVSIGIHHRVGTRNTPSLLNASDGEPLFWDGRRSHLDVAVLDPVVNRVEMGNPDINAVLQRLQADPTYRKAFAQTFHQGAESVSASNVGTVLATFITSLPYIPNAYDRFASGKSDALSPQARLGLRLFTGKAECARCHDPAQSRFTDEQFHHSSVGLGSAEAHLGELAEDVMRRNLPIAALGSAIGSQAQVAALGRFLTSQRAIDVGAFRTPSLRNVALTAPYMHDGSIQTLEAAVDLEIYYRGLATGRPIALTAEERSALIAFLRSLSTEVQLGPEGQAAKKTPVANPERFR